MHDPISISQDHLAIFVLWGSGHDFQGRIKCTVEIIQTADEHRSQTQIFHARRDASCGRCFSRTGSTGRAVLVWSLCALVGYTAQIEGPPWKSSLIVSGTALKIN